MLCQGSAERWLARPDPAPDARVAGQATLLEALQAGIAERLAVLDDAAVTGTGQSSAEVLGLPDVVLAETLAGHLVREIMVRGSGGGPLAPLADQLNHDVTHLHGQRLEGMLAELADQVRALARAGNATGASQPVRLLPRPPFLAGREELLAGLEQEGEPGDANEHGSDRVEGEPFDVAGHAPIATVTGSPVQDEQGYARDRGHSQQPQPRAAGGWGATSKPATSTEVMNSTRV